MKETEPQISFLGTGWSFPPVFQKGTRAVEMVSDMLDIQQSLQILLATTIGERFLQPTYGCNLDDYVFEPLNATIQTSIKLTIKNAIQIYESRITLVDVKLSTDMIYEGRLDIIVEYTIIITNTRYNLVYPFYLNEASRTV